MSPGSRISSSHGGQTLGDVGEISGYRIRKWATSQPRPPIIVWLHWTGICFFCSHRCPSGDSDAQLVSSIPRALCTSHRISSSGTAVSGTYAVGGVDTVKEAASSASVLISVPHSVLV
jgi:hypothetical protein